MKKRIWTYIAVFTLLLALFNVIVFVTPREIGGISKFTDSFWVGYIFITVFFIAQLACACFAFKEKNLKKLFYRLSLLSTSYTGLIVTLVVGSIFMIFPILPVWIGIVVCAIVLAFNIIAVVKAIAVTEIVEGIDSNMAEKTFFIKRLTIEAQSLMSAAKSDTLRFETKRIYEAIRYSDAVSNETLAEVEDQIKQHFIAFSEAVKDEDAELATATANALAEVIQKRNQLCKLLK